ncbi:uncharacterized protein LOC119106030 [Pollicipes pollicipes]|uniref:uncharacterized protein LOC119106030 n=1 Tax=Pollicipes pollicipes TaxID=41117 RepID=UPI00188596EE|nr:uncharacterized protein LOC119106030 [Pollicipes pollicipes]
MLADTESRVNLILTNGAGLPNVFGPAPVPGTGPLGQADRRGLFLDPLELYRNVTRSSGGILVDADKAGAADVLQMLDLAANNSKATILLAYDVGFPTFSYTFAVDQTVSQLEVVLTGAVTSAQLASPRGARFDLLLPPSAAEDARPSAALVRAVISSASLHVLQLDEPVGGDWRLDLASPDLYYPAHVAVRAVTNLDIRASVVVLADQGVTHPGMQVARGKLVTGNQGGPPPHVLLQLVSTDDQPFRDVDEVRLTDLAGAAIADLPYDMAPRWDAYLPLPAALLGLPAKLRVKGRARDGSRWEREALLRVTTSAVTLTAVRPEVGAARPGETGNIEFVLTNELQQPRTLQLHATDDMGYVQSLSDTELVLPPRQSRLVTLRYYVPPEARPGDAATVQLSAMVSTLEDGAAAHQTLTVLGQEEDSSAPTCTVQPGADVDCGDYLTEDDCEERLWSVDIVASDSGAGIHEVHVFPRNVGQLTTDSFVVGIQQMQATYRASCCHPKANITVVDRLGNIGTCVMDLGNVSFGPLLGSAGLVLAILIPILILILLIVALIFCLVRRRKHSKSTDLPTVDQQRRQERHRQLAEGADQPSGQT